MGGTMNLTDNYKENKISLARIYKINKSSEEVTNIENVPESLNTYAKNLIDENFSRENRREFIFTRENVEPKILIDKLRYAIIEGNLEEVFEDVCDELSEKLIESQKRYSERYAMVNLKEGNVIFYLENDSFLISKVDHMGYLNGLTYNHEVGLPDEKPSQKIAHFQFIENDISVILSDSNPDIAKFWSEEFLDLKPLNTSGKNTLKAFNAIDSFIARNVTKISKTDGLDLRNNLIGYFRASENFSATQAKEHIFGTFNAQNKEIDIENIKEKFEKSFIKKEKLTFDTQFDIDSSVIKSRIVKTIPLRKNIDLKLNGHVNNFKSDVEAIMDSQGRFKLIVNDITSDAYENFKR
ncbi:hypothetical protein [Enterococcus faecalis]